LAANVAVAAPGDEIPDINIPVAKVEVTVEEMPPAIDPELGNDEGAENAHDVTVHNLCQIFLRYAEWRHTEIEPIWDAVFRAYRGYKQNSPSPYRFEYVIREIFRQIETLKPQVSRQFFGQDELFRYQPWMPGFDGQAAAATAIAHQQIRRYRMDVAMQKWTDNALLYGTSYMTYGWSKMRKVQRKISKLHIPTVGTTWERQTEDIPHECPFLEYIPHDEVYSHPFCDDIQNSPVTFIRKVCSPDDLKTLVREGYLDEEETQEAIEAGQSHAREALENKSGASDLGYDFRLDLDPNGAEPLEMLICYANNGWEYVIIEREFLVRARRWTERYSEVPILVQRNYPQAGEHYGIPEPLVILDDQRLLNDVMSAWAASWHFTAVPMFKVLTRGVKNFLRSKFQPGGHVPVEDMNDVNELMTSPKHNDLASQGQFLTSRMQLTTGVTQELSGSGSAAKTATQHVRLEDAAGVRMEHKTRLFMPGFQDAFMALYELNGRYLNEDVGSAHHGRRRQAGCSVGTAPRSSSRAVDVEVQLANQMEQGPGDGQPLAADLPALRPGPADQPAARA
jgi:hypothetical protein